MIVLLSVSICTLLCFLIVFKSINRSRKAPFVSMDGKTVLITGGNAGIGKETAKELAKRGARVILACRNQTTANQTKEEIIQSTNNPNIVVKKLDLSSLSSVRSFVDDFLKTEEKLDVLIHNAGMATNTFQKTEDGLELTMATNYFAPFLLTHLLIDLLKKSAPSRIIVVASELYRLVSLNIDQINPSRSWFVPRLYYVSKYANIYFTRELAKKLHGTGITANCLHPGLVNTGIWDSAPKAFRWAVKLVVKGFFKTPEQGAQTTIFLACSEQVDGVTGKYFADCKEKELVRAAKNEEKGKKLWEVTEKLVLKEGDPRI